MPYRKRCVLRFSLRDLIRRIRKKRIERNGQRERTPALMFTTPSTPVVTDTTHVVLRPQSEHSRNSIINKRTQ